MAGRDGTGGGSAPTCCVMTARSACMPGCVRGRVGPSGLLHAADAMHAAPRVPHVKLAGAADAGLTIVASLRDGCVVVVAGDVGHEARVVHVCARPKAKVAGVWAQGRARSGGSAAVSGAPPCARTFLRAPCKSSRCQLSWQTPAARACPAPAPRCSCSPSPRPSAPASQSCARRVGWRWRACTPSCDRRHAASGTTPLTRTRCKRAAICRAG